MSRTPYLYRRGNVFYFRAAVPAELRDTFQRREIVQSLKTEKRSEAVPLALGIAAEVIKLFNDVRSMPDIKHKRHVQALREMLKIREMSHQEEIEQKELNHLAEIKRVKAEAALRAENELLKEIVKGRDGQSHDAQPSTALQAKQEPIKTVSSSKASMLSVVFQEFIDSYKGKGSKDGEENRRKIKGFSGLFISYTGDKKIDQLTQKKVNQFFRLLVKYPGGRGGQPKKFLAMTFSERIEYGQKSGMVAISPKSFDSNYLSPASLFFKWLRIHHEDYAPNLATDHIDYEQYGGRREKGEDKQRALRVDEVKQLMCCDEMKAFASNPKEHHKYWLVLIGLLTGCRVNEICQLNPQHDIIKDEKTGIWYFNFTEETPGGNGVDKSHKNKASKRKVPIHSVLMKCGFEEYFKRIKNLGHDRMFSKWRPKDGKASYYAEKFFREYLRAIGLRDDTLKNKVTGMHSLRSTFISHSVRCMMEKGLNHKQALSRIRPIVGHEAGALNESGKDLSMTASYVDDRIIKDLMENLADLSNIVEEIDYGLEFPKPE